MTKSSARLTPRTPTKCGKSGHSPRWPARTPCSNVNKTENPEKYPTFYGSHPVNLSNHLSDLPLFGPVPFCAALPERPGYYHATRPSHTVELALPPGLALPTARVCGNRANAKIVRASREKPQPRVMPSQYGVRSSPPLPARRDVVGCVPSGARRNVPNESSGCNRATRF